MVKKIISTFMVLVMSVFCLVSTVSANELSTEVNPDIILENLYTLNCSSTLNISGETATCTSRATGYANLTTKVVMEQTLQKKGIFGIWTTTESWSETDYGYVGYVSNTKSSLSSGTYRLKTEFTVYAGSDSETIEKISSEQTV